MSNAIKVIVLAVLCSMAHSKSPNEYLRLADQIRNPSESYKMLVEVSDKNKTSAMDVYLKGKNKTLIVTKTPSRDRGRNMLMLDQAFYAYIPNIKRSVKLSLSQKLSGQVANGDIARTRWYQDYEATVEKEEDGTIILFLKATRKQLTYANIRLFMNKNNHQPIKAEYLSLNGKTVLKIAHFKNYKVMLGKLRPTTIEINSVRGSGSGSGSNTIKIISMEKKSLSSNFFNLRNLGRMK